MRKRTVQFLGLIEVSILLGALALFVLQNPNTLITFLNYSTRQLDLRYDKVSGNLLKTITVKNIRYHDKLLTPEATIDWNIKALLTATLKIDEISVKDLDIPLTEAWIADLRTKFASKESSGPVSIPEVEVSELVFSAKPFQRGDINISRIELQANDIKGDLRHVDIGFFSFLTQSNYADITALGSMHNAELSFEKLWLEDIDIPKITRLVKEIAGGRSANKSRAAGPNLIKALYIDDLIVYTKPLKYRHYDIRQWSLSMRGLNSKDLRHFDAKHIYIDATTNMWRLSSSGTIRRNRLYTEADVSLNDSYFKRFVPFFNHKHIQPIKIYLTVDREGVNGKLYASANDLLIKRYSSYQVDIPKIKAHVTYRFKEHRLSGDIDAQLHSRYTPRASLRGHIYYDREKKFHYDGNLTLPRVSDLPVAVSSLLKENTLSFAGDTKKIDAKFHSSTLQATYTSSGYEKGVLHLSSLRTLTPEDAGYAKVPDILKAVRFNFKGELPVDVRHFLPLRPRVSISSNLADINASATIAQKTTIHARLKKTEKSLLAEQFPKLKEQSLFPMTLDFDYLRNQGNLQLQSRYLRGDIAHRFDTNLTDATLYLQKSPLKVSGNIRHDFNATLNTDSLRELQITLNKMYDFKPLPMDGEITLQARIIDLSRVQTHLDGKWFIYEYKPNRFLFAEKIALDLHYSEKMLQLQRYRFNTYLDRDRYFFATKPSGAKLLQDRFVVEKFWINDQATIRGSYNYPSRRGRFEATARNYHYKDIEGDLRFDTDLEMTVSPKITDIEGAVRIKSGTITYEHRKIHNIQDEDIIIIQDQKNLHEGREEDTLSLDISIATEKPVYYTIPGTRVKLTVDLKLWKEVRKPLELLGIVRILSGTHMQSGKEIELDSSEILFGGDPLNPYLNIRAEHRSDPYTIYINITGQMDTPSINFSATPYLSQSDILSILLFNSTTKDLLGGNQDSSKTAISMFGTVFAKEIVQNFGIKLDKLVLTTTEEGTIGVEVGKKLSKNVTIIYINDIVQTIKVRYKLSDHFEADFIFSPENNGMDIIYKDEY